MKRFAVIAAIAGSLWGSPTWAADEFIYLVNATGGSAQVVIDGQVFPPMDDLMAISIRKPVGEHFILAGVPGPISADMKSTGASLFTNLSADDTIVDAQQRRFWCFIVGKQTDGILKIIPLNQPRCTEFVRRGIGDRPLK
jgi:hypothetical protein